MLETINLFFETKILTFTFIFNLACAALMFASALLMLDNFDTMRTQKDVTGLLADPSDDGKHFTKPLLDKVLNLLNTQWKLPVRKRDALVFFALACAVIVCVLPDLWNKIVSFAISAVCYGVAIETSRRNNILYQKICTREIFVPLTTCAEDMAAQQLAQSDSLVDSLSDTAD